jgi:DNA primase
MTLEKMDFSASVEWLADKAGLTLPHPEPGAVQDFAQRKRLHKLLEDATKWFQKKLFSAEGETARTYLTSRGIDPRMWEKFSLGFAPAYTRSSLTSYLTEQGYKEQELIESGLCLLSTKRTATFERFRGRLMFPISDARGHIVGFGGRVLENETGEAKYLNSPESRVFDKSSLLYGYTLARQSVQQDPVLVVEGYLDVISLHQAGFERVVAPLGTAANAHQIQACWKLCAEPVVMFDGDAAGQKAAVRLLQRLLGALQPGYSARFAFLPTGEDPDSFVRTKGRAALQALIQQARSLVDVLWAHILEGTPQGAAPEQKALVVAHLKDVLSEITHPDIRRFYKEALYQKWEAHRARPLPPLLFSRLPCKTPSVKEDLPFRILLATLINHPTLFPSVEDLFHHVPSQDQNLEQVKDSLFEFLNGRSFEEAENLVQNLKLCVPEEMLSYVLHEDVFLLAPFAHEKVPSEDAIAGFRDVWRRFFVAPSLGCDIQNAKHLLESSFSGTHWERLRELHALWKQEKIGTPNGYDDNDSPSD